MIRAFVLLLLVLAGCSSQGSPPAAPSYEVYQEPWPSVTSLGKTMQLIDRVEIYMARPEQPHVRAKIVVSDIKSLECFKTLMGDPAVAPSLTQPMIFEGPPVIEVYQGSTRLFLLLWKNRTKFQLFETQDPAIAGSYEVSADWVSRYLVFCESQLKQQLVQTPKLVPIKSPQL